ncbi:MAG: creatininase family protein [Planctomycetes bacterium]|nr:creatininase family protein [Planctomycetota bacterium]
MLSIEEMLPRDIAALSRNPGIVLVPVSPMIEWHSWHLPAGTDGLIAEGAARAAAERIGCAWCRCLSMGLDEWRSPQFKITMGLPADAEVFGMRFPGLPLVSEYVESEEFQKLVSARLYAMRRTGFCRAYVINHHGGVGQAPMLEKICSDMSGKGFTARLLLTYSLAKMDRKGWEGDCLRTGGHAGMSETIALMAFRPELVDLDEQADGELSVAATGILHKSPTVPAEFNPRLAPAGLAHAWRKAVVAGIAAEINRDRGFPESEAV